MNSNYPRLLGLQTPWVWVQPRGTEDILRRLAEARDYAVHVQERENLCSVAYGEIVRLLEALRDPVAEPMFATGDVVQAIPLSLLRSGSRQYADAVVVSVNPLVLVSREGDMCWSVTVNDMKLLRVGRIDGATLAVCMSRYVRDYTAFTPLHPESVELDLLPGFPRKVIATGSVNVRTAPAEPTPTKEHLWPHPSLEEQFEALYVKEAVIKEALAVMYKSLSTLKDSALPRFYTDVANVVRLSIMQRDNAEAEVVTLERENAALRAAIDTEPELPGPMPDEMWAAMNGNRELTEETLRIAVRQTKDGILARAALPAERKGT